MKVKTYPSQIYDSVRKRLYSKIGLPDPVTGCMEWKGTKTGGYGMLYVDGRNLLAHRLSWIAVNGEIPYDDLLVCHHCDNRSCCNPTHLFLGTELDNNHDKIMKGRAINLKGEDHGMCILSDEKIVAIRERYIPGVYGIERLSKEYGVSKTHISRIIKNKSRTNIPDGKDHTP